MPSITPTVGRVVLFYPPANSTHPALKPGVALAAQIASVLENGKLNLGVLDSNGAHRAMTEVPLIQDGEEAQEEGHYAEWMPYQKQVAAGEIQPNLHASGN